VKKVWPLPCAENLYRQRNWTGEIAISKLSWKTYCRRHHRRKFLEASLMRSKLGHLDIAGVAYGDNEIFKTKNRNCIGGVQLLLNSSKISSKLWISPENLFRAFLIFSKEMPSNRFEKASNGFLITSENLKG